MADGRGEMCGRLLPDLGADVIRVEPPGGAASRTQAPLHDGVSLPFATHNAGKRGVVIDHTTAGWSRAAAARCWTAPTSGSRRPAGRAELGLGPDVVRARNPGLVVLSITDFGHTGPYRDWVATDWTLLAMGGVLSRSGLPGREPLMPPGDMALQVTAMQAAWAALVAYWNRLESGRGDHIDFSLYEATAQVDRPGHGDRGHRAGRGLRGDARPPGARPVPDLPLSRRPRAGRPAGAAPVACDARVARRARGLQDPELDTIRGRALASDRLHAAFEQHFRERDKHELTLEGQARGVPIAPVLTPADVLAADHFRARGAIARTELARGLAADAPTGFAEIDGRRVRSGRRAPELGEHDDELFAEPARGARR